VLTPIDTGSPTPAPAARPVECQQCNGQGVPPGTSVVLQVEVSGPRLRVGQRTQGRVGWLQGLADWSSDMELIVGTTGQVLVRSTPLQRSFIDGVDKCRRVGDGEVREFLHSATTGSRGTRVLEQDGENREENDLLQPLSPDSAAPSVSQQAPEAQRQMERRVRPVAVGKLSQSGRLEQAGKPRGPQRPKRSARHLHGRQARPADIGSLHLALDVQGRLPKLLGT